MWMGDLWRCEAVADTARAAEPPYVPAMVWPMVGDRWTYRQTVYVDGAAKNSSRFSIRRIPDIEFRNESCVCYEIGNARTLKDSLGRVVVKFIDNQLVEIFESREDFAIWPLRVRSKCISRVLTKGPSGNTLLDLNVQRTIESFEPVATLAGVFNAFKIRRDHSNGFLNIW